MVGNEREDYPTQKPEALLARIVRASSNPGDLVFDCFLGSGTTAAVAQKLGRRWIGCDINKGAIQTSARRVHAILKAQAGAVPLQARLPETGSEDDGIEQEGSPAQLAFSVWRVNEY